MRERLLRGEHVLEVAQVQQRDELLRREIEQQLPERNAARFRPEIEAGVRDGGQGEVDDAFVRPQPAILRVIGDASLHGAQLRHQLLDIAADAAAAPSAAIASQTRSLPPPSVNASPVPAMARSVLQLRHRVPVLRIAVNRIDALARRAG